MGIAAAASFPSATWLAAAVAGRRAGGGRGARTGRSKADTPQLNRRNAPAPGPTQIFERRPTTVKNFGVWVRYQSRTGYHNM